MGQAEHAENNIFKVKEKNVFASRIGNSQPQENLPFLRF